MLILLVACRPSGRIEPDPAREDPEVFDSAEILAAAPADSGEPAVEATEQLCQLEMACHVLPTRDTKVPCNLTVTNAEIGRAHV